MPHLGISELWTLPACHPQDLLTFRGGVSLVRENNLNSGALDLAGSHGLSPVLPVTQTELLTLAPVGYGSLSVPLLPLFALSIASQITSYIYSEPMHLAWDRAGWLAGCLVQREAPNIPSRDRRSWAQVLSLTHPAGSGGAE